ncbi:MAG: NAD(P)-dependent oxidoreductase [Rhizomicrobium sp.]
MKIFLTGGTGFIGSHFIEQALNTGHEVTALRRSGSSARIPLSRQPVWIDGKLDEDHSAILRGCEVFVHFAAHTPNVPYDTLERCLYWNVSACVGLAEQALKQGVRKFLIAGSCFEYGRVAKSVEKIATDCPLEPDLSYPTSKAAASIAFQGLARQHMLQLKILRIFQVYGEGEQSTRLWPSLREAALAGKDFKMSPGEQLRDFISVQEVAAQFVRALDFGNARPGEPRVEHVASGHPETLRAFAERWWAFWGAKGTLVFGAVPYRPNEIMRLVPEI